MNALTPVLAALPVQGGAPAKTLGEYVTAGGPIMIPILICSVVAVAFAFERYLALRRGRACPAIVDEAVAAVAAGRLDEARGLLQDGKHTAGRILGAGLRRHGFTTTEVEKVMEDQAHKEAERMKTRIRPLNLIASVTPLMGLLGTVLGITEAFSRVVETGMGQPETFASGIEMALTTTIAGLFVAIPALLVAAHLNGKVRRLLLFIDEKLAPTVEHLAVRPEGTSDAA